jgi:hypothetical protein
VKMDREAKPLSFLRECAIHVWGREGYKGITTQSYTMFTNWSNLVCVGPLGAQPILPKLTWQEHTCTYGSVC